MRGRRLTAYYLLAWIGYAVYLYLDIIFNRRGSQPYVWSALFASFCEFSFCWFVLYPATLRRRRLPLFVGGLIVAELIFIAMRALVEELVYVALIGHHNYTADTTVFFYMGDNWWRALQPILLSFIIWSFIELFNREREAESLRQEKIRTELAFLKSQINPHFLYNTLNYIYYVAYPVSEPLAEAILRLSGLMRYMLTDTRDGLADLEMEVEYLHNYIDIYRLRFEDRWFVDFTVEGEMAGRRIAALLLIPFVENAFKHGVVDQASDPVVIRLLNEPERLVFEVRNLIATGQRDMSSGIGLANIRRRLELIYPGRHVLKVEEREGIFQTILCINFAV